MTSSWQPIDTAPTEDGTKALLFDGRDQFVGVLTHFNRTLDLDHFLNEGPLTTIQVVLNGLSLRLKAKPRCTLPHR
ncbi:hypothetical protein DHODJN_14330 [Methylorubrum extorquens]